MNLKKEAEELFSVCFDEARDWYDSADFVRKHSENMAVAAEAIAKQMAKNGDDSLDPELVYVCALLHDIGKSRRNWKGLDHPVVGYKFLKEKGYDVPARVSMTHTYYGYGTVDYSDFWERFENKENLKFTQEFMEKVQIDDYDRLIQMVDNMANHKGVMSISDRFSDILVRHDIAHAGQHLKELYKIKIHFDEKCGMNVYELFKSDIIKLTMEEPNNVCGFKRSYGEI